MMNQINVPKLNRSVAQDACPPTRKADIPAALDELNINVNKLNDAIQNLWGRLDNVIRQEPCEKNCETTSSGGECAVSRAIRIESDMIEDLTLSLERMLRVIEA